MNKREIQKRVLQKGKPLSLELFTWDEKKRNFSTDEDNLVIDFTYIDGCTITVGNYCFIKAGSRCILITGRECIIYPGKNCNVNIEDYCIVFATAGCDFNTGDYCTFDVTYSCTFKTGDECVVIRRDVYEVIELKKGQKIELNGDKIKGFVVLEEEAKEVPQ